MIGEIYKKTCLLYFILNSGKIGGKDTKVQIDISVVFKTRHDMWQNLKNSKIKIY